MIHILDFRGYISKISGLSIEDYENDRQGVCEAYSCWGENCIDHLYGSFSFVLFDDSVKEMIGVRDPLGTQPLYYSKGVGRGMISCHIRNILEKTGMEKQLDSEAFYKYFRFGYPAGDKTLYQGIYKVPSGCIAVKKSDSDEIVISRYWSPVFCADSQKSLSDWTQDIHQTMQTILGEDHFSQKPGSFLSSGVDSAYLLAMSDAEDAYGVGYEDKSFDESDHAEATAEYLHKRFHRRTIEKEEYFQMVSRMAQKRELPLGDASTPAFALICETARQHHLYMYSGEGPDELLAGYYAYEEFDSFDLAKLADSLKQPVYMGCSSLLNEEQLHRLLKVAPSSKTLPDVIEKSYLQIDEKHPLNRMLYIDLTLWMEGDIFLNAAETADIFHLQVRTPYCDRRMVDLALRMPEEMKRQNGIGKYAFRFAASEVLPKEVAFRRKIGFTVPVRGWLSDETCRECIEDVLFGSVSKILFHQSAIRDFWRRYLEGDITLWEIIYALYEFILWYDVHFNHGNEMEEELRS